MTLLASDTLISSTIQAITLYSGNWSLIVPTAAIDVHTAGAYCNGGAVFQGAFYNAVSAPNDQSSQITLGAVSGSGSAWIGPAVRCNATNGGNCYMVRIIGTGANYRVTKLVNGVNTDLTGPTTNSFAVNDVILLSVVGTTLSLYQNNTLLWTGTDSSLSSGSFGIGGYGNSGGALTVEDWQGSEIAIYGPAKTITGIGPGVSPNAQMQFRGLSPLSNYIQNSVVPLTGQSISSSQGSLSLSFGGQSIYSSQGTLTPLISQTLTGISVASTTGTLVPFGVITASPPSYVQNAGPGVGPFANWQFSPRVLGYTNQLNIPLTGSSIASSQGTLTPAISIALITAGGPWINAASIEGPWNNTAGTLGGWTSSVFTSTQIASSTGTLSPIQGALVALVGQSLGSAQGDLSQSGSVTVPLVGSLMVSSTGTLTYTIPPGQGADLWITIQALIEAGLIPQLYYSTSQTVPAGFVISLTPPVGTLVEPNTAVVILASTGPGGVPQGGTTVPNLIGLYWYDATTALAQAFLSIDKYLWQVNAAAEGTVIAQSIAAGTSVPAATIIKLTLSAGPVTVVPPIPVP
jgi:PASTA domain-containing protein